MAANLIVLNHYCKTEPIERTLTDVEERIEDELDRKYFEEKRKGNN